MTSITPNPLPEVLPLPEAWRADAGHLSAAEVTRVMSSILRTLSAWHQHGRCHGSLALADVQRGSDEVWVLPPVTQGNPQPEQQGYAAFECYGGAAPDSRADVYAVCAIAWSLLIGQRPPSALMRAVQNPDELGDLDVPRLHAPQNQALGEILLKGLAFFPEDRYASVTELEAAVLALGEAEAEPIQEPPVTLTDVALSPVLELSPEPEPEPVLAAEPQSAPATEPVGSVTASVPSTRATGTRRSASDPRA